MLPKTDRLDTNRFDEIIASGKNINAGAFYLKVLNNETIRFAVVVPKKLLKSSVKRHFLKRSIFNAVKENKIHFPPADYIVFANKDVVEMNYDKISETIKNMAQKLASQ